MQRKLRMHVKQHLQPKVRAQHKLRTQRKSGFANEHQKGSGRFAQSERSRPHSEQLRSVLYISLFQAFAPPAGRRYNRWSIVTAIAPWHCTLGTHAR